MATVIPAPGGVDIYGGANVVSVVSADNITYVVYCGERTGFKFGTHVYRRLPDGKLEWVEYSPFTEMRADACVEPDGLYLTYPTPDSRQVIRTKVPGFTTPAYPGGTNSFPPTPVTVSGEDVAARQQLTKVNEDNRNLQKEIKKLQTRIDTLEKRPVAQAGVSESSARDIAWTLSVDRFYAELSDPNSPVSNLIRNIAREAVKVE